ncbi:MAG: hypothetical protein ACI90V_012483, partial [Bacillariaceae sp.]
VVVVVVVVLDNFRGMYCLRLCLFVCLFKLLLF